MKVNVRVFAHLRERLGFEQRTLELAESSTVRDAWKEISGEDALPRHVLCAINLDYTDAGTALHDGDEVAFFPPVTGG